MFINIRMSLNPGVLKILKCVIFIQRPSGNYSEQQHFIVNKNFKGLKVNQSNTINRQYNRLFLDCETREGETQRRCSAGFEAVAQHLNHKDMKTWINIDDLISVFMNFCKVHTVRIKAAEAEKSWLPGSYISHDATAVFSHFYLSLPASCVSDSILFVTQISRY